jgi:competence ComEA-like helix-hairpin-helix protein
MKRWVSATVAAGIVAMLLVPAAAAAQSRKARPSHETKRAVLDINRATAADFEKLPGIGPELARRIVAYRKEHGPFRRVEDLLVIRGMGEKKWRAIRPYLTVGGGERKRNKPSRQKQ